MESKYIYDKKYPSADNAGNTTQISTRKCYFNNLWYLFFETCQTSDTFTYNLHNSMKQSCYLRSLLWLSWSNKLSSFHFTWRFGYNVFRKARN